MKKVALLGIIFVLSILVGCSSGKEESTLTMDEFIQAYTSQGVEVDPSEKPLFDIIGAIDGVVFYYDNSPVKIYQFDTKKKLEQAKKDNEALKDWVSNGSFLIETKKQEAINIFDSVK